MQDDGAGAAAAGPTKRTRRPSVRLHDPYYEVPLGHRNPQPIKRHSDGAKKPRTVHLKNKKDDDVSDAGKGEKFNLDNDDDVAIGNWKNFNASNRNRDFKRKRVRPSGSKKCVPAKSRRNEDKEIQNFPLSSGGESGKQEEDDDDNDGINSNLVVENTDPSSPNCSFGNDDGDDKLSDDNNNVGANQGTEQRGLKNSLDSNKMGGNRNTHGVRAWLNELGLDKYAPLFEVHEVDDEVLAHLTLEDLKDMGINAVGSRRKLYASIQKLGKGLS